MCPVRGGRRLANRRDSRLPPPPVTTVTGTRSPPSRSSRGRRTPEARSWSFSAPARWREARWSDLLGERTTRDDARPVVDRLSRGRRRLDPRSDLRVPVRGPLDARNGSTHPRIRPRGRPHRPSGRGDARSGGRSDPDSPERADAGEEGRSLRVRRSAVPIGDQRPIEAHYRPGRPSSSTASAIWFFWISSVPPPIRRPRWTR